MTELKRYEKNPILLPRGDDWESIAVFNPAAVYWNNEIHLLYRAVGDYWKYVSRLGHAVFDANLKLKKRFDQPCFGPDLKLWEPSIEDPRFTELEGKLYLTYVVTMKPGPPGPVRIRLGLPRQERCYARTALAAVKDFNNFTRMGIITPYETHARDTVIFPEKIEGKYAVLHRPANWIGARYGTDRPGTWFAYLDRINGKMFGHKLLMKPEEHWESTKIGPGPPPIKTEKGWLLIYHGVDANHVYRAGVVLLDLEQPWKVIARSRQPILEPERDYERIGDTPNVVFPEGAVRIGDELLVFYGGADRVCCAATVDLNELVNYLLE